MTTETTEEKARVQGALWLEAMDQQWPGPNLALTVVASLDPGMAEGSQHLLWHVRGGW